MASIMDSLLNRGKPAAVKGLLSPVEQDKPIGMGLLGDMTNPIAKAMMAYGFTGQGNDPAGAMLGAYTGETDRMSAQKAAAAARAKQQAIFDQIQQGLANGKASPAMAAQYAAMGGEGAGTIMDAVKHVSTPQSYTPGSMMYNTATGAMSMPAPKMGEGQMWDGGRVSEAQGYGDVMQQAINRDLQKYQQQEGIGYGYDVGRMGQQARIDLNKLDAQTQADIDKYRTTSGIGYQYDRAKLEDSAALADREYYDPATGRMMIGNKLAVTQGGYQASKPESEKIAEAEKARAQVARQSDYLDKGGMASKQLGKLNQLESLIDSGLRTGATQPVYDAVGGFLAEAGIDVKGLSANQQAEKMLLQIAQDIPLPAGPASNVDVMQRLAQLPKMTDTPAAFSGAVKSMRSLAELNKKAAAYININGLTPEIEAEINDMYSEWGKGK